MDTEVDVLFEIVRFMRIPFFASGVVVTEDNMQDVADWCGGEVVTDGPYHFVRVPVSRSTHPKQTEAVPGSWILRTILRGVPSYKVYEEQWLTKQFARLDPGYAAETVNSLEAISLLPSAEPEVEIRCCCHDKHALPASHPQPRRPITPANFLRAS